jgi:protein SCO1/2
MKASLLVSLLLGSLGSFAFAVVDQKPAATPEPPCCREGLPPGKFSDQSLYKIDATWTADVGREVKLSALNGRPQVMALFFANCQHSCPFIIHDMKQIQKALPAKIRPRVDFLLVSIDPDRDTPEALKAFRVKHGLDMEHWSLLRGSPEAVKKLADMVGFRYYPGSTLQYAHSLLISVLDQNGVIVYQQAGIGRQPDEAVAVLKRLVLKPVTTAKR